MPPYHLIFPIVAAFCCTAVVISAMKMLSDHLAHRRLSSNATENGSSSDEVLRRLERIEQIVDSTALEVERFAESNRFMAKLLAEKTGTPPL
jgi:hypothetical protein